MAEPDAVADLILPKLTGLLEQALDLAASSAAMDNLGQIAGLCADGAVLARAGAVLQRSD